VEVIVNVHVHVADAECMGMASINHQSIHAPVCRFLPAKLTSRFLLPISSRQIDEIIWKIAGAVVEIRGCGDVCLSASRCHQPNFFVPIQSTAKSIQLISIRRFAFAYAAFHAWRSDAPSSLQCRAPFSLAAPSRSHSTNRLRRS
jgi:hypothetical protein